MSVRSWVNLSRSEVTNNAVALHYKPIFALSVQLMASPVCFEHYVIGGANGHGQARKPYLIQSEIVASTGEL